MHEGNVKEVDGNVKCVRMHIRGTWEEFECFGMGCELNSQIHRSSEEYTTDHAETQREYDVCRYRGGYEK